MGEDSRFMQLVEKVPVDNDKLIGQAVSWFISKQKPNNVDFTQYPNGYKIEVHTDEESAAGARKFWESYVHPELNGDEE